jgi:hypothetical protein
MKNTITSLFIIASLFSFGQTWHKQYPTNNNSSPGYLQNTAIGNGVYYCFNEDSLAGGSMGKFLSVQKNDLAGNVVWKKSFYTDTTNVETVRMLSSGAAVYVGGNWKGKAFIASVDTGNGALNYFNLYASTTFSNGTTFIKDMTFALPNQIVATGAVSTSTDNFLYVLRTSASNGTVINNNMSTFYTDQIGHGICYYGGKLYIVGERGGYPFIGRLAISGNGLFPSGSNSYTAGIFQPSAFYQVECSNSRIACVGGLNAPVVRNFIFDVDTANIGAGSSTITGQMFPSSYNFDYITVANSRVHASGVFNGAVGVVTYTSNAYTGTANTYSVSGVTSRLLRFKNSIYYSMLNTNASSSLAIVRGDTTGYTICSSSVIPLQNPMTLTASVLNIGAFSNGIATTFTPPAFSQTVAPQTLCGITGLGENQKSLSFVVKQIDGKYEILSPQANISSYFVMDMSGKMVQQETLVGENKVLINPENYARGIYVVRIKTEAGEKTVKIIH